jgi:hypothetical protein
MNINERIEQDLDAIAASLKRFERNSMAIITGTEHAAKSGGMVRQTKDGRLIKAMNNGKTLGSAERHSRD